MRVGQCLDLAKLGHQTFVNRYPARGIQDQDIKTLKLRRLQGPLCNLRRCFPIRLGKNANLCLVAKDAQLLTRRRTGDVERGQHHLLPLARAKTQRQLAGGGGLARSLKTSHENDRRWVHGQIERCRIGAKNLGQRVIDNLDDLLVGTHRLQDIAANGLLPYIGDECLDNGKRHIGIQKREPNLAKSRIDV